MLSWWMIPIDILALWLWVIFCDAAWGERDRHPERFCCFLIFRRAKEGE